MEGAGAESACDSVIVAVSYSRGPIDVTGARTDSLRAITFITVLERRLCDSDGLLKSALPFGEARGGKGCCCCDPKSIGVVRTFPLLGRLDFGLVAFDLGVSDTSLRCGWMSGGSAKGNSLTGNVSLWPANEGLWVLSVSRDGLCTSSETGACDPMVLALRCSANDLFAELMRRFRKAVRCSGESVDEAESEFTSFVSTKSKILDRIRNIASLSISWLCP